MQSMEGDLEQQDSRGWTPIMWSSSNGYCKLVKQLIQRGADVHHIGQAKGGNGTTTALHECASMRGERAQPSEGYFETAWLLMAAGASPFTERSDGMTPIEVAGAFANLQMKKFLEGCCLFRGTLAMPVPQAFGSKVKNRYCTVQPRFPLGNAAPTLWMICYRNTNEVQPACKIPLGNARVMIEGPQDSENGILIVPSSSKVPKGVHVRSHTANSYIIEIRAVALAKMPGWKTLRTLADVCKAAGVAVSCRNLDQLCTAALAQAVQQMQLPGKCGLPELGKVASPSDGKPAMLETASQNAEAPLKPISIPEEKPGQIADSAQDMVPQRSNLSTQQMPDPSEPSTPRRSTSESVQSRKSGIGSLFKSAFRMSTTTAPRKYNVGLLDSSSSLGQMSTVSQQAEPAKKSGLFSFKKKSSQPARNTMPSITEQSAGGLTEADISAFSQPIPDKFWSKMGRKMSTQRKPNLAAYRTNVQNWFHEDDGTVSSTGLPPARPKKSFEDEDLTELMYPAGDGPRPAVAAPNPGQPHNIRRQTTDNARLRTPHGAAAFVLEEPIVPTQRMVHAGPRRSFSFDDLDDMVNGGNRKARGHREDFASQMAPADLRRQQIGLQGSEVDHQRLQSGQRLQQEPMSSAHLTKTRSSSMPRRSFSLHDLDQMLQPPPAPASHHNLTTGGRQLEEQQRAAVRRKGPAIDPDSYGGFQGPPAPEWRPYKPASARSMPQQQQQGRPQQGQPEQFDERAARRSQVQADPRHFSRQAPDQPHHRQSAQSTAAHHTAPHPAPHQHQHQPHHSSQQYQHQQHRPTARHPQQQGAPAHRGQPVPQSFQQARPGPPPPARQAHRSSSQQGIPSELAHLASLRALETSNLVIPSLASKKDSASLERALSTNSASASGQENNAAGGNQTVAYEGAEERRSQGKAETGVMTMPVQGKESDKEQAQQVETPRKESISSVAKATPLAPAVPSVLFQGVKIPKNPTPPTRIARERDEVPEIRHSGSHEFSPRD